VESDTGSSRRRRRADASNHARPKTTEYFLFTLLQGFHFASGLFARAVNRPAKGDCRAALNRLLDPDNAAITLTTLQKAAIVVGRKTRLELV
jgi:hypothetical protein